MKFPLGQNVHDQEDIKVMIDTLLTEQFTMGKQVETFEKTFADYLGVKHAVMVNSGSSANLIALSALINHKYSQQLQPGDEVLIPALCWATSFAPIVQCGLVPVFVDIDPKTLNVDLSDLQKKITDKTKAILLVHVLGNCTDMFRLMEIVYNNNLILVEDTCESLGSKSLSRYLGTFGKIGTYSFYYSHHITTMEGGMVVTDDDELYELMKCLRAHGWSRNLLNKDEIAEQYPDIDSRFTFVNLGFNVRPMEIQAAMGIRQLGKLATKNDNRKENYRKIKQKILSNNNNFLSFPQESGDIAWFGITLFIKDNMDLQSYLRYLTVQGVENRPVITGNMVRQPVIRDLFPNLDPKTFPGADYCHYKGLFIGLSSNPMTNDSIDELVNILLSYTL